MGLLDRWAKKNQDKQLSGVDKKAAAKVEVPATPVVKAVKAVEAKVVPVAKQSVVKSAVVKKTAVVGASVKTVKAPAIAHKVLIKPLVTEKAAIMQSLNKYSFLVARDANKQMVKIAVEEVYGVKPLSVNIINMDGKRVRFGQSAGRHSDYRKAMVTIAAGQTLAIHEGV
ncbi:MAG: 50S ribosomal protein L23 [bacterium]|nr:50S ribosomal protein L23 [bacterium]